LKLGKACGFDGIPNKHLLHHPTRSLVHLMHLFNHCCGLGHFPALWKEAEVKTLPKLGRDPNFSPNICPISLLSYTGKLFEKLILIIQKQTEERNVLNVG
jgi:hypothetical protein